ncbi:MAG: GGDEF domain-containing protein [Burkholderiaceae bacterium]
MTQLIKHLEEITGFRDRDQLDASVVRAVHDVLRPLAAGIYRCVGEVGSQRWLTRARIALDDPAATADPPWTDILMLPELDSVPARRKALASGETVTSGDTPQINYFPIATEREVVGVLEVHTAGPLRASARAMVGTIVRIYGNFHDLLDHSERDPLTGLLNRQTFNTALMARTKKSCAGEKAESGRRTATAGTALWLGVVDIDHFKRVNDNFGHPIGDEVLLLLSRLLRSNFRHVDRLYRFGGEEFVVVLDCVVAEQACIAFERLRANVERFEFPQVGRITVSIGFTSTDVSDTPSSAFARADKALYHVKEHGRNGVAQFESLVRDGQVVGTQIVGEVELF